MLQFCITDLPLSDSFSMSSSSGVWEFVPSPPSRPPRSGEVANTYLAINDSITPMSDDSTLQDVCEEVVNGCLGLSFLTAKCVTPSDSGPYSQIKFFGLGDRFIRPRAIEGFPPLEVDFPGLFLAGPLNITGQFKSRWMRLLLCHWISGLTCFSLEDLFLAIGVQFDIVKQCERIATGDKKLTYYEGMESASKRYAIPQLSKDFKNMRNDIVHEGRLSGTNFSSKTKSDCAQVIAESLTWIDRYAIRVMGIVNHVDETKTRWEPHHLESGLSSVSL